MAKSKKKSKAVAKKSSTSKAKKTSAKVAKKAAPKKAAPKKSVAKKGAAKKAAPKKAMASAPKKAAATKTSASKAKISASSLQIAALRDRVVIEPIGESDRTPGGLYIPQTAEVDKPQRGRVLSVGSGLVNKKGMVRPLDVKIGDEVLYGKYAGTEFELQGYKLLILKESDIVGILA